MFKDKKRRSDTKIITVRVRPELYKELKQQAETQNIPLTDYVKTILAEAVERHKMGQSGSSGYSNL